MANRLDRGWGQPDECLERNSPQLRVGPDPRKPSGPAVLEHRVNRPDTRLYLTWPLCRQQVLATWEPSTQDEIKLKADIAVANVRTSSRHFAQSSLNCCTGAAWPYRTGVGEQEYEPQIKTGVGQKSWTHRYVSSKAGLGVPPLTPPRGWQERFRLVSDRSSSCLRWPGVSRLDPSQRPTDF